MANIALFHSVLGIRPGVLDAAERFESAGHRVTVVDQYDGQSFDDYDEAMEFAEDLGYPDLMGQALDAVVDLPDGFVAAGFSNGGAMAEFVASERKVAGVLMFSGAMPMSMLTTTAWPTAVPAQIHYTVDDPFRMQDGIDELLKDLAEAGAQCEFFDYAGSGHLFTDPSLPTEYDAVNAELLFSRALSFVERVTR